MISVHHYGFVTVKGREYIIPRSECYSDRVLMSELKKELPHSSIITNYRYISLEDKNKKE